MFGDTGPRARTDGGRGADGSRLDPVDARAWSDGELPAPGIDSDGDGLDDRFERAAGDPSLLDERQADTDGNGTDDGDEDPDGDGLVHRVEQTLGAIDSVSALAGPHPFRADLVVELDAMQGREPSHEVLLAASETWAAAPREGLVGARGIGLHFYLDQMDLPEVSFDGSFEERHAFLASNGPRFDPSIPGDQLVHVVIAGRRTDQPNRGGEVVTEGAGEIEKSGVFVYYDALAELHPQCGLPQEDIPAITLDEALASTLAHELGHVLQLGHESDAGGAINYFNVMSVPTTCMEAQQRFHGLGNDDASLGATDVSGASRFSDAAVDLMRFDEKVSVDVSEIVRDGSGLPM